MTYIKKFFYYSLIHFLCFYLALGESIARIPTSSSSFNQNNIETLLPKLNTSFESFYEQIKGKSDDSKCKQAASEELEGELDQHSDDEDEVEDSTVSDDIEDTSDEEFQRLMDSLLNNKQEIAASENTQEMYEEEKRLFVENACAYRPVLSKEDKKNEATNCKPVLIPGIQVEISTLIMKSEKNEKEVDEKELIKHLGQIFYKAAIFKKAVQELLQNDDLNTQDKSDVLVKYLEKVLMPTRDMYVSVKAYLSDKKALSYQQSLQSLLLRLPSDILDEDEDLKEVIKNGVNPSMEPFGLVTNKVDDEVTISFDSHAVISRDLITLLASPTKLNYIRSLRLLTIQMMLSQKFTYQSILGLSNRIDIPKSCKKHLNTEQDYLSFSFKNHDSVEDDYLSNDEVTKRRENYFFSLLFKHGLTLDHNNIHGNDYFHYYMESLNINPFEEGVYRLLPFDQFKVSYANRKQNKEKDKSIFEKLMGAIKGKNPGTIRTSLNDLQFYEKFIQIRSNAVESSFIYNNGKDIGIYQDEYEVFKSILEFPDSNQIYEIKLNEEVAKKKMMILKTLEATVGDTKEKSMDELFEVEEGYFDHDGDGIIKFDPSTMGVNTFLAKALQRHGTTDLFDIVPEALIKELESTKVSVQMPEFYSSTMHRNWGISSILSKIIEVDNSNDDDLKMHTRLSLKKACRQWKGETLKKYSSKTQKLCTLKGLKEKLQALVPVNSNLIPLISPSELEKSELFAIYPYLKLVWSEFVGNKKLGFFQTNEFDFIKMQMVNFNPWAMMRLSYLILKYEVKAAQDGFTPVYRSTRRGSRASKNTSCFNSSVKGRLERLDRAANFMGLNQTLSLSMLDRVVTDVEKNEILEEEIDKINEDSNSLYTTTDKSGRPMYEHIEKVSYFHLFNKKRVENYLTEHYPFRLHKSSRKELNEILSNEEIVNFAQYFEEIYKAKGDKKLIESKLEDFLKNTNLDDEFQIKSTFLLLDTKMKEILYKDILRKSAEIRLADLETNLNRFCQLDETQEAEFKKIFFSTTKIQNNLNQVTGIPAIPPKVIEEVESFAHSESGIMVDMALGMGAFLVGIGAKALAGACTLFTGGACLPIGVAMIAGAGLALGMQGTLIKREYGRWDNAQELSAFTRDFEYMGFAEKNSYQDLSNSKGWIYFETLMLLPLIGIVSQALVNGGRLIKVSGDAMMSTKSLTKPEFKSKVKETLARSEDERAKVVLGFLGFETQFGSSANVAAKVGDILKTPSLGFRSLRKQLNHLKETYRKGNISFKELIKRSSALTTQFSRSLTALGRQRQMVQTGKITIESIDARTTKVASKYFNNEPKALLNLLESYTSKWSSNPALRNKLVYARAVNKKAKLDKFPRGTNWFYKLRFGHLAEHNKKLSSLIADLKKSIEKNDSLDAFIYANLESLTDLFINIPMRKRDLPYVAILQGGPHTGGIFNGRRMSGISQMGDGILMRKLFNARSRLLYNTHKSNARQALGFAAVSGLEQSREIFKSFQNAVNVSAHNLPEKQADQLLTQLDEFRDEVAQKLMDQNLINEDTVKSIFKKLDYSLELGDQKQIARILFYPENIQEKAVGDLLWEKLPMREILKGDRSKTISENSLKGLSDYNNLDEFQSYIDALYVLLLNKNPGLVEVF